MNGDSPAATMCRFEITCAQRICRALPAALGASGSAVDLTKLVPGG